MKKIISLCLLLLCFAPLAGAEASTGTVLKQRLMGRIVLAVESHGEAYYISPKDQGVYYVASSWAAFKTLQSQGLGVSEKDFNNFNKYGAPKRLSGRILLRVQATGEAYYVNPLNLKLYSLNNFALGKFGLGISNNDLDMLLGRTLDKEERNITYLISKEAVTKFCNGNQKDSAGYGKTITSKITTDIPKDTLILAQLAKQTVELATTEMCQAAIKKASFTIVNGEVKISPIEPWAGITITMCSCVPQVEVNLLRIPGVTKVTWEK